MKDSTKLTFFLFALAFVSAVLAVLLANGESLREISIGFFAIAMLSAVFNMFKVGLG